MFDIINIASKILMSLMTLLAIIICGNISFINELIEQENYIVIFIIIALATIMSLLLEILINKLIKPDKYIKL